MLRAAAAVVVRSNASAAARPIRRTKTASRRSSRRASPAGRSSTVGGGGGCSGSDGSRRVCASVHPRGPSHSLRAPSSSSLPRPPHATRRHLSAGIDGLNGESPSRRPTDGESSVASSAATARWKRDHYRKIEERFSPAAAEAGDGIASAETNDDDENATTAAAAGTTTRTTPTSQEQWDSPPEAIDDYDDVQPVWKEMEGRVTRRRSLTHAQRGGVSGRRNLRRSDEDVWLEAGVYDDAEAPKEG